MIDLTHAPPLPPHHVARLRRDHTAAVSALRDGMNRRPGERFGRPLGRLLTELHRPEEAEPAWESVRAERPADIEAVFHLAALQRSHGGSTETAVAEVRKRTGATLSHRVQRQLSDPVAKVPPDGDPTRHIALAGVSFSGSTLLDRVLGGLPGVASIGESHWLTKSRINKISSSVDASVEEPPGMPYCSVCGPSCEVLSLDFRISLAADSTRWYDKIANRLGTSVLISADKNWQKLVDNDPLLQMDAVVLFKSPDQAWHSQKTKLPTDQDDAYYIQQLERYIDVWSANYEALVGPFRPTGQTVFLSFDHFCAEPADVLSAVTHTLGLPEPSGVLNQTTPGHAIGGNRMAMSGLRGADYGVQIQPLPQPDLTQREREMITGNERMQSVYAAMIEREVHQ